MTMKKPKMRGSSWFLVGIMVVALAVLLSALQYDHPKAKLLPLIVGGLVLALSGMRLSMELRAQDKPSKADAPAEGSEGDPADQHETPAVRMRKFGISMAWIAGFVAGIYLVGFVISMPAYVLAFTKTHGVRWRTSVISAVLATAVCYAMFVVALQLELYPGRIFGGR